MKKMVNFVLGIGVAAVVVVYPSVTFAGLFDSLKAAANQLEKQAQSAQQPQAQNGTDADHPLNLQYHGSCDGHRTATCMDYNEGMDQCMAPIYGYRMKMLGDRIEWKFKNDNLTDQQRKNLQEDLAGAREAEKNHSDEPTIAGQAKSQRYLSDISEEDQVWVNAEFMRLRNRIYNKCEGADHMGVGHRTEFITDYGPTGDEAVAEYRKSHQRRRHSSSNNCMQAVAGVRYKIMADMMEKKMQTLKLSDKERNEWLVDIEAVRQAAASGGTTMPKVDDPVNPYRPITRLSSPDEQMALNNQFNQESRALLDACKQSGR